MELILIRKIALVTGASKGIGKGIADGYGSRRSLYEILIPKDF